MKVLFLDTNIFLQCLDLKNIPWKDVLKKEDELLLLIPHPVQEEIDRFKQDGNSRRADRARKTNSFFRDIINSPDECVEINNANLKVIIKFPPPVNKADLESIGLDLSRADDRIIAETLLYKRGNPSDDVALLTHDTGPMLTAKRIGLPFLEIPDSWLLLPEPDKAQKKIDELSRKLVELKKTTPEISIALLNSKDTQVEELNEGIMTVEAFSDSWVTDYLKLVTDKYPMENNFSEASESSRHSHASFGNIYHSMMTYHPPSQQEILRYQNEKYPEWVAEIKEFIKSLPSRLEKRYFEFQIHICNVGHVPAENVLVAFRALGGLLIAPPSKNGDEEQNVKLALPLPPPPPKGIWKRSAIFGSSLVMGEVNAMPSNLWMKDLLNIPGEKGRDRNTFYFKHGRPVNCVEEIIYECDELRHQTEPEVFNLKLQVPPPSIITKGAISCRVSAKNVRTPYTSITPIKINYSQGNAHAEFYRLLNKA